MSAEENMRIVRRIYEQVFGKHNLAVVDEVYAPGFVYHTPGRPDSSRSDLRQGFADSIAAFPDLSITVDDMFATGDRVVVRSTTYGTQRGEYRGVPPTGKQIAWSRIVIHRLAGGKLVEDWEWSDQLGFFRQLGLVKLPQ